MIGQVRRGVIRTYDSTNHNATVQLFGSPGQVLDDVPVAHHLGGELIADGTACLVAMFESGDPGVIVATWNGLPAAWVTSALIKDGEVAVADLAFDPATQAELDAHGADEDVHHDTPIATHDQEGTDQLLTTSYVTLGSLSQTVSVPANTKYVVVIATVTFICTAYTGYNQDWLAIYEDAVALGAHSCRHYAVGEMNEVSVVVANTITGNKTYTAKVMKAINRNAEKAVDGNMVVIEWYQT